MNVIRSISYMFARREEPANGLMSPGEKGFWLHLQWCAIGLLAWLHDYIYNKQYIIKQSQALSQHTHIFIKTK